MGVECLILATSGCSRGAEGLIHQGGVRGGWRACGEWLRRSLSWVCLPSSAVSAAFVPCHLRRRCHPLPRVRTEWKEGAHPPPPPVLHLCSWGGNGGFLNASSDKRDDKTGRLREMLTLCLSVPNNGKKDWEKK